MKASLHITLKKVMLILILFFLISDSEWLVAGLQSTLTTIRSIRKPLFALPLSKVPSKVQLSPEISHIGVDIAKILMTAISTSKNPTIMMLTSFWRASVPSIVKTVLSSIHAGDLLLFAFFQLTYKRTLRWAHKAQVVFWRLLSMGSPQEWDKSILKFLEERAGLLSKVLGINYAIKMGVLVLNKLGFHIRPDFPILISRVAYALYAAHFVDIFKSKFLHDLIPGLGENRRQSYVVNRSTSVVVWVVGILVACEIVSTYAHVPLSSTLAFGGFGGLALGLSARDIAANFLGGMLLLFNEPFTPGDMVTFRTGNAELIGRVERVGWGQTRIRGRDTRPTYIPNSHFVQTAVTNMERITHRKFETNFAVRFQDAAVVQDVVTRIKDGIRTIPKLDVLSMPYRVSLVKVGSYGLEVEITCYFATKSIDEFLALQQLANLEILKAVSECGAQLALPSTQIYQVAQPVMATAAGASSLSSASSVVTKNTPTATQMLTKAAPQQTQTNSNAAIPGTSSSSSSSSPSRSSSSTTTASSPSSSAPLARQTAHTAQTVSTSPHAQKQNKVGGITSSAGDSAGASVLVPRSRTLQSNLTQEPGAGVSSSAQAQARAQILTQTQSPPPTSPPSATGSRLADNTRDTTGTSMLSSEKTRAQRPTEIKTTAVDVNNLTIVPEGSTASPSSPSSSTSSGVNMNNIIAPSRTSVSDANNRLSDSFDSAVEGSSSSVSRSMSRSSVAALVSPSLSDDVQVPPPSSPPSNDPQRNAAAAAVLSDSGAGVSRSTAALVGEQKKKNDNSNSNVLVTDTDAAARSKDSSSSSSSSSIKKQQQSGSVGPSLWATYLDVPAATLSPYDALVPSTSAIATPAAANSNSNSNSAAAAAAKIELDGMNGMDPSIRTIPIPRKGGGLTGEDSPLGASQLSPSSLTSAPTVSASASVTSDSSRSSSGSGSNNSDDDQYFADEDYGDDDSNGWGDSSTRSKDDDNAVDSFSDDGMTETKAPMGNYSYSPTSSSAAANDDDDDDDGSGSGSGYVDESEGRKAVTVVTDPSVFSSFSAYTSSGDSWASPSSQDNVEAQNLLEEAENDLDDARMRRQQAQSLADSSDGNDVDVDVDDGLMSFWRGGTGAGASSSSSGSGFSPYSYSYPATATADAAVGQWGGEIIVRQSKTRQTGSSSSSTTSGSTAAGGDNYEVTDTDDKKSQKRGVSSYDAYSLDPSSWSWTAANAATGTNISSSDGSSSSSSGGSTIDSSMKGEERRINSSSVSNRGGSSSSISSGGSRSTSGTWNFKKEVQGPGPVVVSEDVYGEYRWTNSIDDVDDVWIEKDATFGEW